MIKAYSSRKLSRPGSHRRALLRNLSASLILNEKVTVTFPKAKELQRFVERIISAAKAGGQVSYRKVQSDIKDKRIIKKLFDVMAQRYSGRQGGYTQIFKLGYRKGDSAPMAVIKLVQ